VSEQVELSVPGMSCEHCRRAITEALVALPAVENVQVDLETKRVTIAGSGLDDAALRQAILEAGYEAEP
jgi:copper chaperone